MSKQQPIQIIIPAPCTQNWEEMTADGRGRFCAHCQKTVIDFTTWSDTALYNFFSKDQSHTCGRFLNTQLDRKISIPYQPHSRLYRIAVALGLTLMFTQTPDVQAQSRPPKATQDTALTQVKPAEAYGIINGLVLSEKKEPLTGVLVHAYQGSILKGSAMTDYDGRYIIRDLDTGHYDLGFTYSGYKKTQVLGIPVAYGKDTLRKRTMTPQLDSNDTSVITTRYTRPNVIRTLIPKDPEPITTLQSPVLMTMGGPMMPYRQPDQSVLVTLPDSTQAYKAHHIKSKKKHKPIPGE